MDLLISLVCLLLLLLRNHFLLLNKLTLPALICCWLKLLLRHRCRPGYL